MEGGCDGRKRYEMTNTPGRDLELGKQRAGVGKGLTTRRRVRTGGRWETKTTSGVEERERKEKQNKAKRKN